MKSYTDIEQSRKLEEILPIESADMFWIHVEREGFNDWWKVETIQGSFICRSMNIPCWSLSALLNVMPVTCDDGRHCLALINSNPNGNVDWLCCYEDHNGNLMMECYGINQVDACYEMIVKLHELNFL